MLARLGASGVMVFEKGPGPVNDTANMVSQPSTDADLEALFAPRLLLDFPIPVLMVAALGASAWFGLHLVTAAIAVLVGVVGAAKVWSLLALRDFKAERRLAYSHVFPDDEAVLEVRVENRKLLPMPWVEVVQRLPAGLQPEGAPPLHHMKGSLLWRQAVTFRIPLTCRKRGYYRFTKGLVMSGDPFGAYPRRGDVGGAPEILVYPHVFPLSDAALDSATLFGDALSRRRLLYDPSRTAGSRDYVSGDPLRHVHWKATAKRRHLQVKVFEPSTSLTMVLLLDVESFQGKDEDDLELAISATASIANHVMEKGGRIGLLANARLAAGRAGGYLPPQPGADQLGRVLETLALVTPQPLWPFAELVATHLDRLPRDATLGVVVAQASPDVQDLLRRAEAGGRRVILYTLERGAASAGPLEERSLHDLCGAPRSAAEPATV